MAEFDFLTFILFAENFQDSTKMGLTHHLCAKTVAFLKSSIPELKAIYLFGSTARGDVNAESDIDLAVLAKSSLTAYEKLCLA